MGGMGEGGWREEGRRSPKGHVQIELPSTCHVLWHNVTCHNLETHCLSHSKFGLLPPNWRNKTVEILKIFIEVDNIKFFGFYITLKIFNQPFLSYFNKT